MTDLAALPKTELHLHLEGAAPPDFIRALVAEQGVALEGVFDDAGGYRWDDFADFLDTYMKACSVLKGPAEYHRLTEAVLAQSAAEGVIYTEIFLCPDICGGGDPAAWVDYLAAITEAAAAARARHGIEARFIATCIRNLGPEAAQRTARLAAETAGPGLTGFGLAGEERHLAPADFAPAFDIARAAGLGLTAHAGELCGPESVAGALDHLRPTRIGHGVRAIEDPALVARLAAEGVLLEVSPGSNIALGIFPDWQSHPVAEMRAAGVAVCLSTDDPPYFNTTLTREYRELAHAHGWTAADFRAMNIAAMDHAFCDAETRAAMTQRLKEPAP